MCDYLIIADGGSRGNGTANAEAYGSYQIVVGTRVYGPYRLTFDKGDSNNSAEYKALLAAVRHVAHYASPHQAEYSIEIQMDSQLVLNQVQLAWKCKHEHLRVLRDRVREVLAPFAKVEFTYIPEGLMKAILGH